LPNWAPLLGRLLATGPSVPRPTRPRIAGHLVEEAQRSLRHLSRCPASARNRRKCQWLHRAPHHWCRVGHGACSEVHPHRQLKTPGFTTSTAGSCRTASAACTSTAVPARRTGRLAATASVVYTEDVPMVYTRDDGPGAVERLTVRVVFVRVRCRDLSGLTGSRNFLSLFRRLVRLCRS